MDALLHQGLEQEAALLQACARSGGTSTKLKINVIMPRTEVPRGVLHPSLGWLCRGQRHSPSASDEQRAPEPPCAQPKGTIMLGLIITIIVVGLIAGALARLLVPGRQDLSIPMTILLGIIGSFDGGFLGYVLVPQGRRTGIPAAVRADRIGRRRRPPTADLDPHGQSPHRASLTEIGPSSRHAIRCGAVIAMFLRECCETFTRMTSPCDDGGSEVGGPPRAAGIRLGKRLR
jgi:uncharacterized membrane protein YeaQ/YmgE (transglycosylase-associated protein family)